jgi:hypothetical protein
MRVRIFDDAAQASRAAARHSRQLTLQPASVLGLPTGRTSMRARGTGACGQLSVAHTSTSTIRRPAAIESTKFPRVHASAPLRRVNVPAGHVNFLDGDAKDLDAECARSIAPSSMRRD